MSVAPGLGLEGPFSSMSPSLPCLPPLPTPREYAALLKLIHAQGTPALSLGTLINSEQAWLSQQERLATVLGVGQTKRKLGAGAAQL